MKQTVVLKFWNWSDEKYLLKKLEEIGRVSHLSDQKITEDSCYPFIKMIINQRHLGILEHENITFKIRTNRAIANELVRHRHFTFVQESTRYVNYNTNDPLKSLSFISNFANTETDKEGTKVIKELFDFYKKLVSEYKIRPEDARDFLPLGLKTTLYATANIRSWLHFLDMRSGKENHALMMELAGLVRKEMIKIIPIIMTEYFYGYEHK